VAAERFPLDALRPWLVDLTIRDVAHLAGVSQKTLYGKRAAGGLSLATADRLAVALNLHPGDIWPDGYWEPN
jgi:lambda repressor-like predicted transcriptional regulator